MVERSELERLKHLKRAGVNCINLNPLQRGGILYPEARDALQKWGDGYSVCDFCEGRLDRIKNPPIFNFITTLLPNFLDVDIVRVTNGAREAQFIVMHAICEPGETVVFDGNAHYTTYIAAERHGLNIKEVTNTGYPEYRIRSEDYQEAIEDVKRETGKTPTLVLLTYPDGNYGNLADAKEIVKIAHELGIPVILNAAYSVGRMPISTRDLNCDFIVGSGHKSMAASGPIGILGMKKEFTSRVLRSSKYYQNKEIELLGCTSRGASIMTLMTSFPFVVKRVKKWNKEVEKARWFAHEIEKLGLLQLGEKPHNHDLMFIEAMKLFEISKKHPRKGYFLYRELKKRGITGIKAGLTKNFKLSTYNLTKEELLTTRNAFEEIIDINSI